MAIAPTRRPRRLSRRWRSALLVIHIISAVSWIGVGVAMIPLVIAGLIADDGEVSATAHRAIAMVVPWTVPTLSLLILITGMILGLGTKWGVFRFWWIAVKLVISIVLTVLVFVVLLPGFNPFDVTSSTTGDAVRDSLNHPLRFLFRAVFVGLLLIAAVVISVIKPWGRTTSISKPWDRAKRRVGRHTA